MNVTLDETMAHYSNAGDGILSILRQHAFDRDEFSIAAEPFSPSAALCPLFQ